MARIVIATDAWHPQVSGVVRTLDSTARVLRDWGHAVDIIEPTAYSSVPTPFYPEIPLALPRPGQLYQRLSRFRPDFIHISTEGPLGLWVRHYCQRKNWRFTTSYHTRFPEYLNHLVGVPEALTYHFLRWFHAASSAMMVATPSLEKELLQRGFTSRIRRWSRGVDLTIFRPRPKRDSGYQRPVLLYVGRLSHEKGIDDFLKIDSPGSKFVVGDGPARAALERQYPQAVFFGYRKGQELGEIYAAADLFVFPSKTDTFGVVVIEALASALPVAAYPVTGPADIITDDRWGALDQDLSHAVARALKSGDPEACVMEGRRYTWESCTQQFLDNLVPVRQ